MSSRESFEDLQQPCHNVRKSLQTVSFYHLWAAYGNINESFLQVIGILKRFVLRKSGEIGKIENTFQKRHLAIFLILRDFCLA